MRGKLEPRQLSNLGAGLIPAHAGKTDHSNSPSYRSRAHPRACGENLVAFQAASSKTGSSPRMRGKRRRSNSRSAVAGLIPAHAGKTVSCISSSSCERAHPRACGENTRLSQPKSPTAGSSPRMRGKHRVSDKARVSRGLIPAHAGKTGLMPPVGYRRPAHPRACGENTERSGVLALRSVRSWKTLSFPSSLKVTHCRAFVQLPFSRIRL